MSKLTLKALEEQNISLSGELAALRTDFDNLVRIVRDNVKTKYGSVKQKDSEGNRTDADSVYEACEAIKP